MSFLEQTNTKEISLKFPPCQGQISNLVETSLAAITEHVQVQKTAALIMYTVPISKMAVNQQQAKITQIAPKPLSATSMLQETINKMMSRMTQMENTMSQIQANIPVQICSTFNFLILFKPCCPFSSLGHSKFCSF